MSAVELAGTRGEGTDGAVGDDYVARAVDRHRLTAQTKRVDIAGGHLLSIELAVPDGDNADLTRRADQHIAVVVDSQPVGEGQCGPGRGAAVAGGTAAASDRVQVPNRHLLPVEGARMRSEHEDQASLRIGDHQVALMIDADR